VSRNFWAIADLHFFHDSCWKTFKLPSGQPLRPFSSSEEMNETLVDNWNRLVKPNDKCYILGDISMNKSGLQYVKRLAGHKRIILGNHDDKHSSIYHEIGFDKILSCKVFSGKFIMTHIPIHESCVDRFTINIHGHLHANYINSPKYLGVSCEQTNYSPLNFDEIDARILSNKIRFNETGRVCNYGGGIESGNS
jgi:calcineurin-like phosphoesterase family protein